MRETICFAYFADGKFIGWYSDTFGTITDNRPKIYGNTPHQLEVIQGNFSAKVKKSKGLAEDDFLSAVAKAIAPMNSEAAELMTSTAKVDKLAGYTDIELRVVECPIYDGPNPDYDEAEYLKKLKEQDAEMEKAGIFKLTGMARYKAAREFIEKRGRVKSESWIYADYEKVKEWASKEPTEFLQTIKPILK